MIKLQNTACPDTDEFLAAVDIRAGQRVLQVAVARLRRAGRVRAIGRRHQTRYYPLTAPQGKAATVAAA